MYSTAKEETRAIRVVHLHTLKWVRQEIFLSCESTRMELTHESLDTAFHFQ
jgi:hypothetical protein